MQGIAALSARGSTGRIIKRLAKPMLTGIPWATTLPGSTKPGHLLVTTVDSTDTDSYYTPAVLRVARLDGGVLGNLWGCNSSPVGGLICCQR